MSALLDQARRHLETTFGFQDFRPGQAEIVETVLAGRDVLAIMPTGSGKSLCYQLPALALGGVTLVVSPLLALMRDQVLALRALGIGAASLNSANSPEEERDAKRALRDGSVRLLYMAPERLVRDGMIEFLREVGVERLVVDEAHCVSEWGHDFRPEYQQVGRAREALGVPIAAFTATADAATRDDVMGRLFGSEPELFIQGFDRPNLALAFGAKTDRRRQVRAFVDDYTGQSGIIYCSSRKKTEELADYLSGAGFDALPYHAGMPNADRAANQDRFQKEDGIVIVATSAFGMGIDKPDVRFVVQADLPKTIESYYQEIGRAGRDGLPAGTLTLYGLDDIRLRRQQIDDGEAPEARKRVERHRLNALVALCEAPHCRRQTLLAYFGEASAQPCGHCDLCAGGAKTFDGTLEARKALSAIARTGERFATEHIVNILTGDATENVLRHGHEALPTFGVGAEHDKNAWRSILRQIYAAGLLEMDVVRHGRWVITETGSDVLFGRAKIELREDTIKPQKAKRATRKEREARAADIGDLDASLVASLKQLRTSLAREEGVPAYVVFPDRTLLEMAAERPSSLLALSKIHGVGARKLERYGQAFLEALGGG